MKRTNEILASIFVLLLTLGMLGNPLNSALATTLPSLYVSPTSYTASSLGENVPIQVYVYLVFNLTGFQFQLGFNTTLLHCLNASMGSFFPAPPNSASTITIDNTNGIVSIQAHLQGSGTPVSGFGSLLSTNFNATYATTYPRPRDVSNLTITGDTLFGIGNQPISHNVGNGRYTAPYAPPQLDLTLSTSKTYYHFEDRISVNGTLTGNGYPIPDGLVAIDILNQKGTLLVARTLQTSSSPPSCPLQIAAVMPCDMSGNPQNSFRVASFVYFNVTVLNPVGNSMNALVIVNAYDSSNASIGVAYFGTIVPGGGSAKVFLSIPLQYDPNPYFLTPPTSGNATVYASVWTDFIENGGTPLALESQARFTITGTAQGQSTFTNPPPTGAYQTSPSLHFIQGTYSAGQLPNYTINVEAKYMGNRVTQTKQIHITIAGDINMDGKANLVDLVILANAYGSKPGDHNWNASADINGDGSVNLPDLVSLAKTYGEGTV